MIGLVAADFNGDGLQDLLVTQRIWQSSTQFELAIFVNDGQGGFKEGTRSVFSGAVPLTMDPRRVVVSELNGDGRPDIFVGDEGQDVWNPWPPGFQNTLVLSATGGHLVDATANLPRLDDFTHAASAADIDGDADTDLYVGNTSSPPYILKNHGAGSFQVEPSALPTTITAEHSATASAFVDANADGYPDLVIAGPDYFVDGYHYGPNSFVLLNDGTGRFSILPGSLPAKPFAFTGDALDIQPIELNGDGLRDLLIAWTTGIPYYEGKWIQVLISNGDGSFRDETSSRLPQQDYLDKTPIFFIDLVDLNHDGHLDIATQNPGPPDPDPPFFLNDGSGAFVPLPLGLGIGTKSVYAFTDTDGDGGQDLVSLDWQRRIRVHRDRGAPQKTIYARISAAKAVSMMSEFGQSGSAIPSGTYRLVVMDESTKKGFCVKGPGVNFCSDKKGIGRSVQAITLQAGREYKIKGKGGAKFTILN